MARWKSLLLAGAFGCWPALGFAQVNPPSPPADLGVPALPPGAVTNSVPASVAGPAPVTTSAPGRVSLSDRTGGRTMGSAMPNYGVPDVSGMPRPEGMMYTGMGMQGGAPAAVGGPVATPSSFAPGCDGCGGGLNFFGGQPVGVEPCGTTIQARGPSGWLTYGGVTFYHVRRSDPSILYQTTTADELGGLTTTSIQEDYRNHIGTGWYLGTGWLCANGWFGTVTYHNYHDTVHNDRVTNDGTDPNLVILYTGPGPLGSGAGGGEVLGGAFLDRHFDIDWQNLDITSGVVISPAECLDVLFTGGVRLSKLTQNYNAFINFGDGTSNGQLLNSKLEGIGPRVGIETRVYPLAPFMLYARANTSLLYTHREETATTSFVGLEATNNALAVFNREEILPSLELAVGAEVSLWGGRVLLGGGYEFNYLFEAGSTYTEQSSNPRSARHVNLAIDGAVAHITFLW